MKSEPYTIERTYKAPLSKVWKAISEKEHMKEWYFKLAEFKPEPGFKFEFTGKGSDGSDYVHYCEVIESVFEKKLSYTWTYKGLAGRSRVTFELFAEGHTTRLKLTHEGIETFANHGKDFQKESFSEGWTHIVGKSLKDFLEN
ncbi:ATPase [Sphingobacteriaceae bacterium]|nr:ATPase [Sphingobacteriaceae bacterium]